jgi:heme exporter protein A
MSTHLEVAGLACSRGSATLFRDVSFTLRPGEWIAVRGPNGSGKTTLLRCVAGLTCPDRGSVQWSGPRDMIYAGHLAGIKDDLSALENLDYALRLRGQRPEPAALGAALGEVGLAQRAHLPARRLSAGQRRRIGLARLALDLAASWILDEPFSALDDDGRKAFGRLLAGHLERGGFALVATHDAIAPQATRVCELG